MFGQKGYTARTTPHTGLGGSGRHQTPRLLNAEQYPGEVTNDEETDDLAAVPYKQSTTRFDGHDERGSRSNKKYDAKEINFEQTLKPSQGRIDWA